MANQWPKLGFLLMGCLMASGWASAELPAKSATPIAVVRQAAARGETPQKHAPANLEEQKTDSSAVKLCMMKLSLPRAPD